MTSTGKFVCMAHHFILLRLNRFGLKVASDGWQFEHSMSQLRVGLSAEGAKDVSRFWLSPLRRWGSLTMTSTGKFVYMAYHFILLRLNPFGLRVDREGWWFEHSMSQLQVCLSTEGARNVSLPSLFPVQGWGSLTMTSTGKFLYIAHHFILLRLNPFGLRVESEGWWFEHSMSQLQVGLSTEGARSVSWPSLFRVQGWGSLTVTSIGKFVCMAHQFILLWLNPFALSVDSEGWWFEHSLFQLRVCLSIEGAKNVSFPWISPLGRWVSLTMTSTGKVLYIAHIFILLQLNHFGLWIDREGWWFEHSVSQLQVFLSAEGAKKVSCFWISPLPGWGSLTMTCTGIVVYLAHHFILLRLNPFGLRVDREGCWFQHSISQFQI